MPRAQVERHKGCRVSLDFGVKPYLTPNPFAVKPHLLGVTTTSTLPYRDRAIVTGAPLSSAQACASTCARTMRMLHRATTSRLSELLLVHGDEVIGTAVRATLRSERAVCRYGREVRAGKGPQIAHLRGGCLRATVVVTVWPRAGGTPGSQMAGCSPGTASGRCLQVGPLLGPVLRQTLCQTYACPP